MQSDGRIHSLLEQRNKELDKINYSEERLKSSECAIKEASKAEEAIKKRLIEEDKSAKEEDEEGRRLDEYRLRFRVEMLDEESVGTQLDAEIEEFYKLLELQIKQLHPARQKLVDRVTDIIKQFNSEFEVVLL